MYVTKMSFCFIHCELYLLGKGDTKVHIFVLGGAIISFSRLRVDGRRANAQEQSFIFERKRTRVNLEDKLELRR